MTNLHLFFEICNICIPYYNLILQNQRNRSSLNRRISLADKKRIETESVKLMADKKRLILETKQLADEIKEMSMEKVRIIAEKSQLSSEKDSFLQEIDSLKMAITHHQWGTNKIAIWR